MDQFRIRALKKILDSKTLSSDQSHAAEEMLREKIAIYAQGARKRGKNQEAAAFESLIQ